MISTLVIVSLLNHYFNYVQSANILCVFACPSISHQVVFQPIWRELSLRGHQVTVVTPDPLNDPTLVNLTEINVRFTYDIVNNAIKEAMSKESKYNVFSHIDLIFRLTSIVAESELNSTQFRELIQDRSKKFDLVLLECLHPVMYALGSRFQAPIILVSSLGAFNTDYELLGNPTHPVLYPDMFLAYHSGQLTLIQKIRNILVDAWRKYYHHYILMPQVDKTARKYFGNDIPYLGDLEKNVSMLFVSVNALMFNPRPTVPAVIELGQTHIKPVKPLPSDLKKILDEATEGVVYFSLGSNVKSVNLQEKLRKEIVEGLSELPYKVIWKWESEHLPGKPDNVIIRKWLPQQDILAHPNVKVFVTQGGLQSIEEAISREVPMVVLPFMLDQPMNMEKVVSLGIALGFDLVATNKDKLKNAIIEVAKNDKYKKKIKEIRDLIFDKPMTGLEKAVWWTEYVIRHKGARHLRSPTADISWFDFLLLDVIFVVLGLLVAISYLCLKLIQICCSYSNNKIKFKTR